MAKVSVLVAVYNAEKYLCECLGSLLRQTLRDIQIICIDDCSTDNSLAVLRRHASSDDRIDVIALPENRGQAFARNEGLKRARGTYTCMLDADDWFSADALERAVEVFEAHPDTDSVLFEVQMIEAGKTPYMYAMPQFDCMSGDEAFEQSLTWRIHGLYMTRTALHRRYPYDTSCRLFSDDNTTRIHYLRSRSVRRCTGIYCYRQHPSSATHVVSVRRFDYLRANESMRRQMTEAGANVRQLAEYENHRWLNLVDIYMFYHCHGRELPPDDRRYGLDEIKRTWQTIDRSVLDRRTTSKFGYRPMPSWWLFRAQEWLYFTLRGIIGKNR